MDIPGKTWQKEHVSVLKIVLYQHKRHMNKHSVVFYSESVSLQSPWTIPTPLLGLQKFPLFPTVRLSKIVSTGVLGITMKLIFAIFNPQKWLYLYGAVIATCSCTCACLQYLKLMML